MAHLSTSLHHCHECSAVLPSEHILDCHLLEAHSVLHQLRRERGERTLLCLDGACPDLFSTEKERAMHAIEVHLFPPSYRFEVVRSGLFDVGLSDIDQRKGGSVREEERDEGDGQQGGTRLFPELEGSVATDEVAQQAWKRALASAGAFPASSSLVEEQGRGKRKRDDGEEELEQGGAGEALPSREEIDADGQERPGTALLFQPRALLRQSTRRSDAASAASDGDEMQCG